MGPVSRMSSSFVPHSFQGAGLRLYLPFHAVPETRKFLLVSTPTLFGIRYSKNMHDGTVHKLWNGFVDSYIIKEKYLIHSQFSLLFVGVFLGRAEEEKHLLKMVVSLQERNIDVKTWGR